jgi:polyisoprenoid-binding protein YceI
LHPSIFLVAAAHASGSAAAVPTGVAPPAAAAAAPAPAAPRSYTLDGSRGELHVRVFKDPATMAAGIAHDHAVLATGWTGRFTWDAAQPAACQLTITVPVASLDPDPPALRAAVGLPGALPDNQRGEIKAHLLAESQLWAARFPSITFQATACRPTGSALEVTGNLTIRGQARKVVFTGQFSADEAGFRLKGSLPVKATDHGFQPYSALLGAVRNQDRMVLHIDLQGIPG